MTRPDNGLQTLSNRTFDEIQLGESASIERILTSEDIQLFALLSGGVDPDRIDQRDAASDHSQTVIAHGMWAGALIASVISSRLPGPGTVYRACDGAQLGTVALPSPEQRLGTIGRWLLTWTNENSRTVVELRDPWPDTPLWRQTYSPDAKAALIDDNELAIFEPSGP